MKKLCMILIVFMISLIGCTKAKIYDSKNLVQQMVQEGISQKSISEHERKLYDEIYMSDREVGHARIFVYKNATDAQEYWNKLEDRYDNLQYSDDRTATGYLKGVCDASIEEWIHYEGNVIIFVERYVGNEWAIYIGEDGEEYYGDGTKVSDVKSATEQKDSAEVLQNKLLNCLK